MAPRGQKRAAEKAAGALAKKQCNEVVDAIDQAESLPESCREMMQNIALGCLTIHAADRHGLQVRRVAMVAETLAGVQKELEGKVAEHQAKVDREDADKAERTANEESARKSIESLEKDIVDAKEATDANEE